MLLHELGNCVEFRPAESPSALKNNRVQPEFRDHALASHMDMRRFSAVKGHKEEKVAWLPLTARIDRALSEARGLRARRAVRLPYDRFPSFANRSASNTPLVFTPFACMVCCTAWIRFEKFGWVLKNAWSSPLSALRRSKNVTYATGS